MMAASAFRPAVRSSLRSLAAARPPAHRFVPAAAFHSTPPTFVQAGDALPDVDLTENAPDNKVNLGKELGPGSGKALIVGVPAAFSPACTASHIPGYMSHPSLSKAGKVFVVAVNDPFVMKAWGSSLDPKGSSGIRFLADPAATFTSALDLTFDGAAIFGGPRGKRYALVVEDGKVLNAYVEPDNTGVDASSAEKVLG